MVLEEFLTIFIGIFTDYTLRYVALGSAILGITSGALGCFTVLRKQKFVWRCFISCCFTRNWNCISFCWNKRFFVLDVGCSSVCMVWWYCDIGNYEYNKNKTRRSTWNNTFSFFGLGIVLLTYLQSIGGASQGGLDRFLFGQAAAFDRNRCYQSRNFSSRMFCSSNSIFQGIQNCYV